jgi:hypothetical protein
MIAVADTNDARIDLRTRINNELHDAGEWPLEVFGGDNRDGAWSEYVRVETQDDVDAVRAIVEPYGVTVRLTMRTAEIRYPWPITACLRG